MKTALQRLPAWLVKKGLTRGNLHDMKLKLRTHSLHTVCEEARCPNIGECFGRGTATIMIMGDVCTRSCGFCSVRAGIPNRLDLKEPKRVASLVKELELRHVVITSVTRDDLPDGGAGHFAGTVKALKHLKPNVTIEVLVPDFGGKVNAVKTVCDARPDIFNHNLETVERLTPIIRDKRADYNTSLNILKMAGKISPKIKIKSGIMIGMGETADEVKATLRDLHEASCNIVTIGQYLQPKKGKLKVKEYLEPALFEEYKAFGESIGIEKVFSGPLVRSSYLADRFA